MLKKVWCARGCGAEVIDPIPSTADIEIDGTPHMAHRCRDRLAKKLAEQTKKAEWLAKELLERKARATRAEDDHTAAEWSALAVRANDAEAQLAAYKAHLRAICAARREMNRRDRFDSSSALWSAFSQTMDLMQDRLDDDEKSTKS